ncbi:hypothetical protein SAMN05660420_01629 [Desulfuromusa kysingii]|uniref:Tetratricopeptide repeat-containing protein n=1 Tax=Desulfuromusa kysingii TaxID=37625 RepID=A0A1H3ZPX5_9BACT|nr:hypothetical protein [Desulfuromusa kysingii]SEA25799.1 hypothetical protein SAMN05660420_01629 [Desulfuromusa kysingii]
MISFFQAGFGGIFRPGYRWLLLLLLLLLLNGCVGKLNRASRYYYSGQPQQALDLLDKGESAGNRNQLLFLFERGVVLHQLGEYRQSISQLLKAAQLIDQFEIVSLSEQAGSLVTNEWLTRYKGESSERLWVHSYLMMNYLLLGEYDDALVEAKQALTRLQDHPELQADYFTRSLIALCFANLAEDNDAYLVYRQLADDLPSPAPVAADIVRYAKRLGMVDEVEKYQPYIPQNLPQGEAELVLFVANGRIPLKRPGNVVLPPSIRFAFPYYPATKISPPRIDIRPVNWRYLPPLSTDLGVVARKALDARKARIIAKESLRVAAKEAIAQSVGNKNDAAAEAIVRVALFLLEEPDTRSWQTLPGRLTLVRIPLPAGRHKLQLEVDSTALNGRQIIDLPELYLRQGQRIFYPLRLSTTN